MCSCCHKTIQLETAQQKNSSSVYLVAGKATFLFSGRQSNTSHKLLVRKDTAIRYGMLTTNSQECHDTQRHRQQGSNKE